MAKREIIDIKKSQPGNLSRKRAARAASKPIEILEGGGWQPDECDWPGCSP